MAKKLVLRPVFAPVSLGAMPKPSFQSMVNDDEEDVKESDDAYAPAVSSRKLVIWTVLSPPEEDSVDDGEYVRPGVDGEMISLYVRGRNKKKRTTSQKTAHTLGT